jgi:hypothetical protein
MKEAVLWKGAIGVGNFNDQRILGVRRQRFDVFDEVAADIIVAKVKYRFHASPPGANAESTKSLAS